jgi:hypothetical protein
MDLFIQQPQMQYGPPTRGGACAPAMSCGAPDARTGAAAQGGRDVAAQGGREAAVRGGCVTAGVAGENAVPQRDPGAACTSGSTSTQGLESSPCSIAGEAYREERAYAARRHRHKLVLGMLRTVGVIVAVPVIVTLVFVASYALTCVLEGATPEELVQALSDLWEQALRIVRQVAQFASGS